LVFQEKFRRSWLSNRKERKPENNHKKNEEEEEPLTREHRTKKDMRLLSLSSANMHHPLNRVHLYHFFILIHSEGLLYRNL